MSKLDVITIGDCTVDTFLVINEASIEEDLHHTSYKKLCLRYGDKVPIKESVQSIGGNAANVALGLKKQGYNVGINTELGDDINGHIIQEKLEKEGVNTDMSKMLKDKNSRYAMILQYQSERTVLSYYTDRNYTLPDLPDTKYVYYTSLGDSFQKLQQELIEYLKQHPETKLAINPGSYQIKNKGKDFKKILPHTHILFANRREAALLSEKKEEDPREEIISTLKNKGVEIVVMTEGAEGVCVSQNEKIYKMKPYPEEAVGKTGAGDAFASGFLGARLENKGLTEATKWGTANATGVIRHVGANEGVLTKSEIQEIIDKYPKVIPKNI